MGVWKGNISRPIPGLEETWTEPVKDRIKMVVAVLGSRAECG